MTEILGEDADWYDDDVPLLENNAHEGLPDVDNVEGEEVDGRCCKLLPPS